MENLTNSTNSPLFTFPFFSGPGLYEIYCKPKNKRYIGEAGNVLERLGKHSSNLKINSSEWPALQADWNTYGSGEFEIRVFFVTTGTQIELFAYKKKQNLWILSCLRKFIIHRLEQELFLKKIIALFAKFMEHVTKVLRKLLD